MQYVRLLDHKKSRRTLYSLFIIFIIVSLIGCSKHIKTDVYTVEGEPIANIVFFIDQSAITSNGINIEIKNETGKDLEITGLCYLEKKNYGWQKLTFINDDLTSIGVANTIVRPDFSEILSINWENEYGSVEKGQYRIVVECILDGQKYLLAKTFELK